MKWLQSSLYTFLFFPSPCDWFPIDSSFISSLISSSSYFTCSFVCCSDSFLISFLSLCLTLTSCEGKDAMKKTSEDPLSLSVSPSSFCSLRRRKDVVVVDQRSLVYRETRVKEENLETQEKEMRRRSKEQPQTMITPSSYQSLLQT